MTGNWHLSHDWVPTPQQQQQFQQLYDEIVAGNQRLNLTRITNPADFWEKHLWDSLQGIYPWLRSPEKLSEKLSELTQEEAFQEKASHDKVAPENSSQHYRVIDIGTGGGFPGLPVAIARPDWQVTLLDSTRKKIAFLQQVIQSLNLKTVKTLCDRAEQLGQHGKHRESFHIALVRAVGSPSACAEYALPLLQMGGTAVLYRGQWSEPEAEALQVALDLLGGSLQRVEPCTTPLSHSVRHCVYVQKTASTPRDFPRAVGIPAKYPLEPASEPADR
jgi:16S rRNA (guanine527-N7)-methyltransferase